MVEKIVGFAKACEKSGVKTRMIRVTLPKDFIKAHSQSLLFCLGRLVLIVPELAVVIPQVRLHRLDLMSVLGGVAGQTAEASFHMHPAQSMNQDGKLFGPIAVDD